MRDDGGANHAADLNGDFQSTVPTQAKPMSSARSWSLSRGSNMPVVSQFETNID
jgi:hypothetical protein